MARRCYKCGNVEEDPPWWAGWALGISLVIVGVLLIAATVVATKFYMQGASAIAERDAWKTIAQGWQAVVSYDDALSHGTKRPSRLATKKPPTPTEKGR